MPAGLGNTPQHHVLLQTAYGDHQVANITAETEARTIGARGLFQPLVAARYGAYQDPFWGIAPIANNAFPYNGSAITLFDTGPVRTVAPGQHNGTDAPPTLPTGPARAPTRHPAAPPGASSRSRTSCPAAGWSPTRSRAARPTSHGAGTG